MQKSENVRPQCETCAADDASSDDEATAMMKQKNVSRIFESEHMHAIAFELERSFGRATQGAFGAMRLRTSSPGPKQHDVSRSDDDYGPVVACGQAHTMAVHIEDAFRNSILRSNWSSSASSSSSSSAVISSSTSGWKLPCVLDAEMSSQIDLRTVVPQMFIRQRNEENESKNIGEELHPEKLEETPWGWQIDGLILGGKVGKVQSNC